MLGKKFLVALAAMSIFNLSTADVNSDLNFMSVSKVYAESDYARAMKKCDEGYKLYQQKDYEGAIKLYTEAINMGSSYLNAYIARSEAYYELKKYNEAMADLNKIIELVESNYNNDFPKGSESYNWWISKGYACTAILHNLLKDKALENLAAVVELAPDSDK